MCSECGRDSQELGAGVVELRVGSVPSLIFGCLIYLQKFVRIILDIELNAYRSLINPEVYHRIL